MMNTDIRKTGGGTEFVGKIIPKEYTSVLSSSWGTEQPERGGLKWGLSLSTCLF